MPLCSAIAVAAIGAGTSAALAGGNGADPVTRDLYKEITDTARAQRAAAPIQLATQREYQPQQTALNLQNIQQFLSGTPGGTSQIQYQDFENRPIYAPTPANYNPRNGPGWNATTGRPNPTPGSITGYQQVPVMRTRTVTNPAQPGLLDYYQHTLQPQLSAIDAAGNTATRTADINDIQNLGPEVLAALRNANPQQTALRDELYRQGTEDLAAGGVSPWEKHQLEQNIRGSQAARGFGYGVNDAAAEAYYVTAADQQRRVQNQQEAAGLISLDQSLYGDPYLQITGRTGGASPTGTAFLSQAGGQPLNDFNPFDPYGADVGTFNANAQNAANISASNRRSALAGGIMNMTGSIAGAALRGPSNTVQDRVRTSMYG